MNVHFQYKLDDKQKAEWTEFWCKCKHSHAQQHLLFGEIEHAKGRIPIYTIGELDGTFVCAAIFSIRPKFFNNLFSLEAVCLRGPAFDEVDIGRKFLLQIITYFKKLKVGVIILSPYWMYPEAEQVESLLNEYGFFPFVKIDGHRSPSGLVDLNRSNDEILRSFSNSTRYQIRLAGRSEVTIRPGVCENDAWLAFHALSTMRKKRGINPLLKAEFDAVFEHILLNNKLGILLNAFSGSTFLGCLWIVRGPFIAIPLGYAVLPEKARELSSNLTIGPVLWWEGIKWAKEIGCNSFDMEGYSENTNPGDSMYQVYQFKSRFKPVPVDRINQHGYVCNTPLYTFWRGYLTFKKILRISNSLPFRIKKRLSTWKKVIKK